MRRLFKKYNLLLWLALILIVGSVTSSVVTLTMSRDMLQQSVKKDLPLISDNVYAELQINIARALIVSAHMPDDVFVREWMSGDEQDYPAAIAYLKSAKQKDNSVTHFLITEKDQKYVDSLGAVRTMNQEEGHDGWYRKASESNRAVDIAIAPDQGDENHPLIFVSYQMLDTDRHVIGIAGITFAADIFSKAISQGEDGAAHSIYFVDHSGQIVISDKKSNRAQNIHQQDGMKQIADDILNDRQSSNHVYEKTSAHASFAARYLPDLNLTLIVENSVPDEAAWPVAYANAGIGLIMTVLALVLAWFSIAHHQNRLRVLASKDSMTGLMNRQSFTNSFQQIALEMQRLKLPLSFILFDIDYLKKINESLGHSNGDKIIMDIARMSKTSVRGSDLLCRWGGEQFALLLRRCELEQAYKVAEQLRLNVQNHSFSFDDRVASVTISLGVAEWTENETIDELFSRVDDAVYLAKSEGRNRAEISYFVEV